MRVRSYSQSECSERPATPRGARSAAATNPQPAPQPPALDAARDVLLFAPGDDRLVQIAIHVEDELIERAASGDSHRCAGPRPPAHLQRIETRTERRVPQVAHRHPKSHHAERRHGADVEVGLRVALRIHELHRRGDHEPRGDRLAERRPKLADCPVIFSAYIVDSVAVIAQTEGRKCKGDLPISLIAAGNREVGDAQPCRQSGGVPPGGRRVIGDGDKRPGHTLCTDTRLVETLCKGEPGKNDRRERDDGGDQPTSTAAATTVVHRPFLSPTAVCVTFCVRTIWFDSW